jgi:hypothetical protein
MIKQEIRAHYEQQARLAEAEVQQKLDLIDQLDAAAKYLAAQSYTSNICTLGYDAWYDSTDDAIRILGDAALRVAHQPLWEDEPDYDIVVIIL